MHENVIVSSSSSRSPFHLGSKCSRHNKLLRLDSNNKKLVHQPLEVLHGTLEILFYQSLLLEVPQLREEPPCLVSSHNNNRVHHLALHLINHNKGDDPPSDNCALFLLNMFQNINYYTVARAIWTATVYKVYKVQRPSRRREKNF